MKKSHMIALSGISSAFALICVVASIYVEFLTLTFSVLSAVFISLPFTKNYWAGGILSYVVCSIIAFLIGNINSLPFILFFGAYAIIQWSIEYKLCPKIKNKIVKYLVAYTIKLAYLQIVVAILWFLANAVIPTLVVFGKEIKLTYLIFSLGSIPFFLLYDIMMHLVFKNLVYLIKKVIKDNKTTTTDDDFPDNSKPSVFEEDFLSSDNNDDDNNDNSND